MSKYISTALLAALALAACSSSSTRDEDAARAAAGTPAGSRATAAAPAAAAAPGAAAVTAPAASSGILETELGLAKGSVFDTPAPAEHPHAAAEPGGNRLLPRMNTEAPPLVPHGVGDYVPITRDANACVDCHAVAEREPGGPVPLPASHFVDLRNAPGARRGTVAGARWVCTSCHVTQTDAAPLVRNNAGS
jgi:cytochrome c-type protein NapB